MSKILVTVLTPTFNRNQTLTRLYDSLVKQTSQSFQWLIIDDGSSDDTHLLFQTLKSNTFTIDYHYKTNGGKHTALNFAHPYIKGDVIVIVDSDDYLLPDAIKTIEHDWEIYSECKDICGLSYFKGFSDGTHLSLNAKNDYYINDDISFRVNNLKMKGDRCEVVRTDLFKEYSFPEFNGEKFISEDMLWNRLAYKYKTVYRNKLIYICEYLKGGLSDTGRKLRLECGNGMATVTKTYLTKRVRLLRRIKSTWLYICYAKCAKWSPYRIIRESGQYLMTILNYPFGWLLYHYWKFKYLNS